MAEYIERKTAIEMVGGLKRFAWAHPNRAEYRTTVDVDDVRFGLHFLPASDVEKVVRCKDCAKCREKDMFGATTILECRRTGHAVKPDGYCSEGTKKGD